MAQKHEITLTEDMDGFLGYDPDEIAKIDIEASKEEYEKKVTKLIRKYYPDLIVNFNWDGGRPNYVYLMDADPENYDHLQDDLEWIEEQVYNSQDFWVMKVA